MELRVLKYFLAVAREESITNAAKSLHLSQPTLSKQIRDMEEQLGKELMIRGSRKISLTPEGLLLKKRAEEILELVGQTEEEIRSIPDTQLNGELRISGGETKAVRVLMEAVQKLRQEHPSVKIHFNSGDLDNMLNDMDTGLAEFGLQFGSVDHSRFNCLEIPPEDIWGVLMRKDDPLAKRKEIRREDLFGKPMLFSRQSYTEQFLPDWFNNDYDSIDIAGFYTLAYNASLMVEEGLGYALVIDGIVSSGGESNVCFRPLKPRWRQPHFLIWKKYQKLSVTGQLFLDRVKEVIAEGKLL